MAVRILRAEMLRRPGFLCERDASNPVVTLTGCFEIVSAPRLVLCSRILSSFLSMTPSLQRHVGSIGRKTMLQDSCTLRRKRAGLPVDVCFVEEIVEIAERI